MTAAGGGTPDAAAGGCATAWISRGIEELMADFHARTGSREPVDFDVVIVGSGYGGAVAAAGLAGCAQGGKPLRVCVLERGREYLPGMFPQRMADLAQHVRFTTEGKSVARGEREGLFDVRVGSDVCAVVANGVGGGSLINAGVMEAAKANVFAQGWPAGTTLAALEPYYEEARKVLGAVVNDPLERNTIKLHPKGPTPKFDALATLAAGREASFVPAAVTIAMTGDRRSSAGVVLEQCLRCGDCAMGCNHQAKDSLDVNLLVKAARAGARIFTGATVLKIERTKEVEPGPGGAEVDVASASRGADPRVWTLNVVHTEGRLRARQGPPFRITARNVILAAGTFGSTEILMRSETDTLKFSRRLGQRFSTNGDMIAVVYDQDIEKGGTRCDVGAAADESTPPGDRAVGPTISGIVDLREQGERDLVVEELAVPGPLARLFEETVTMGYVLQGLARADPTAHDPAGEEQDPCAVDGIALRRSSIVALMGDDHAEGALELVGGSDEDEGDGAIRVRWPAIHELPLFAAQIDALRALAHASRTGGEVLPNPLWQLLPDKMQMLLDNKRGPLLTVHPLGGCPMGNSAQDGAVDEIGQVFDGHQTSGGTLPGLAVLDGSIVPVALRINPSLTIAALALRALDGLRRAWHLEPAVEQPPKEETRPVFCAPRAVPPARRTEVEFVERMSGPATLARSGGGAVQCIVELTLHFARTPLLDIVRAEPTGSVPLKRTLRVETGELRIFAKAEWDRWRERGGHEDELDDLAQFIAPVSGKLNFLHREASTQKARRCRALRAWFFNRGLRDSVQEFIRTLTGKTPPPPDAIAYLRGRWEDVKALASHAGEVRLFEYDLTVEPAKKKLPGAPLDVGTFEHRRTIAGRKRFTYERRANPWSQLSRMTLDTFPGLVGGAEPQVLELDTTYLAQERVALMRIVREQDEPSALVDLAAFGAYFVRLLLWIHVWSFRRPDAAEPREPQRLPGIVAGLPEPEIRELDLGAMKDGRPVRVRLTRYPRKKSDRPPVVMIHGYSASGTTFAHPAVDPNLAQYFWDRRRDVWVLDLRTSSGMPTARYPWAFEEVALADLPAAFEHIHRETGEKKLDIFAHCMGSAMFSMALLAPPSSGDPFFRERERLPQMIHRVVLSQIGPVVVFSPANIFRAYLMSYIRNFLPLANYEFRVGPDPTLTDQLIDRFLAAMPYPKEEFDLENPFWPPWRRTPFVGTRHRMDALYGRDFNLANIDDRVLEYIDDLFGPLSIDTVSQAINFARLEVITSKAGRNEYVSRENFLERWNRIPTLSIHGRENGLADVATLARMKQLLADDLGLDFQVHAFDGFGHQDSLIGRDAGQVFAVVHDFLDQD